MAQIGSTGGLGQFNILQSGSTSETTASTTNANATVSEQSSSQAALNDIISQRENVRAQREALDIGSDTDPLEQAAAALSDFIPEEEVIENSSLRIEQDENTGRFIYQSIDNVSGEVLRQFPPEQILEFLSFFRDPEGIVVDDEA